MQFTAYLFGREVLSLSLEMPETPQISDLSSLFIPTAEEAAEAQDDDWEEEEPESRKVRLGFRQMTDR